jgi:hypothetical protein
MAGIPDADLSDVQLTPDAGMCTCPLGDGPAYEFVVITAKRSDTTPIEGIPYSSFFFTVTGGDVTLTEQQAETNASGIIQFDCVGDETIIGDITIEVQIYTVALNDSDTLSCNSVDMNNDGTVAVQDATLFVGAYGTTNQAADFNWDGSVAVQDATIFVGHYGH